jgi:hypothetical protein
MNDASATLRGVAPDVGTGKAEIFTQELHQQGARFDITGDGLAVHRHGHGCHDFLPNSGQNAHFSPSPRLATAHKLKSKPI